RPAEYLVKCIEAADVFSKAEQIAGRREQPGGVQPPGALKDPLSFPQAVGKGAQDDRRDDYAVVPDVERRSGTDRVDAGLATQSARGRRHERTLAGGAAGR